MAGRKPYKPTDEQRKTVEAMAAYGVPEHEIGRVIRIDAKTLRKHFREELDTAHTRANAQVAGFLFSAAKGGNVTAMIFWLKTRAKWKESPTVLEHTGSEGGPIEVSDAKSRLALILGRKPESETDREGAGATQQ